MKWMGVGLACIVLLAVPFSAQQIPPGTALPVMLNSSLDAKKDKPGHKISARVMQMPSGIPLAMPLAMQTMSGSTPESSIAHHLPVRPQPD